MKKKALLLLMFLFLLLSIGVTAEDNCQGEITHIDWKVARDFKFTANVDFKNTGEEVCNYRVYIYDEWGKKLGGEPDPWKKLQPDTGTTNPAQLTNDNVRNLGKKFTLKLYHVGGVWPGPVVWAIGDPLDTKTIDIGFECTGRCHEGGEIKKELSYFSEADCWKLLGQDCGKKASCEKANEFEECQECCEEKCSKDASYDPNFKNDFLDACRHECGKTCNVYYEILRIEKPNTNETRVIDPTGYTQTITTYDKDCEQISGDFTEYERKDVPQCRATQEAALDFELIFPGKELFEGGATFSEESESGECEIFSAQWDRTNAFRGEKVKMLVDTSKECKDLEFRYIVCEDDNYPFGWCTGTDDKIVTLINVSNWITEYDHEGFWDAGSGLSLLPPEYYFVVEAWKNGKRVTRRSSSRARENELIVSDCVDDALLLCQGTQGNKPIYGVSNATRYRKIASKSLPGGKTKHWILDKEKYRDMDAKKCYDPDNKKNYEEYTLVDNPKYVKFVKENFGEEPLFKKYEEMYGEDYAAYLYCYKTPLRDTKGCREVINYEWYSLQNNFSLNLMERIEPRYMEEAKRWNYWQDVDEQPQEEETGVWTKIFTVTPFLEDQRNNLNWTSTGNGSVYVGAGFERTKACEFSCDAQGENDALEGCEGVGSGECSSCYQNRNDANDVDCTKSGMDLACEGDGIYDCDKICKIDAYYSDDERTAETTFTIPNVKIPDGKLTVEKISDNIWKINHPAFNITERGNLEFEVKKESVKFSPLEDREDSYKIERTYDVKGEGDFIINSDIVFNYDLLEVADELDIRVEHRYEVVLKKDIYRVACEDICCATSDEGECLGYEHLVKEDFCQYSETIEDPSINVVTDHIKIPQVSHSKITDTAEVSITGLIDQFVDEFNNTKITGSLNVTLNPDILGIFLLEAKSAAIVYQDVIYPTKHQLFKRESSSPAEGDNTKEYTLSSRYGYEDTEGFNFLEQCKKVCPSDPQCNCSLDNPLEPECLNFSSDDLSRYKRDDCACLPSGCYPNPCVSNRTFHEEEGSRVVNGDFEQEVGNFWKVKEGTAERESEGHSGYKLKLDGKIYQNITPATHSQPYGELCLEYEIDSASELKVTLTEGDEKKTYPICPGPECSNLGEWNKKCFPVESNLSQVELVSKGVTYIDNVNLGKFYDFVNFQTLNLSELEYMDRKAKGWTSLGLFSTDGIIHDKNSYLFGFETLMRRYPHPRTGDLLVYTVDDKDILKSRMSIYTFFRNGTFPLFPARRAKNLYINVTLRNATKLSLEYLPHSYKISPGSQVTVKLELSFFKTGEPIPDENISLEFVGENLEEICKNPDTVDLNCFTEEGETFAQVKTNNMGRASFSFKPEHSITLEAFFAGNERASPAISRINIPILSLKSPLFSLEFLVLILIFYLAVFSYRFFQPSRADIYHWWEELKGKKL